MRVTSTLIRVQDQVQLWSAAFDRELTSTLGLQRELSAAIAEQVRGRASPERVAALDHRQTDDQEAYDLYLRGRYYWGQLTPAGTRAALEHYDRAIARDPKYALAWAGSAVALSTAPINSDAEPSKVIDRARHAAQRAVEESPSLAEALFAKGYFHFWLEPDLALSRRLLLAPEQSRTTRATRLRTSSLRMCCHRRESMSKLERSAGAHASWIRCSQCHMRSLLRSHTRRATMKPLLNTPGRRSPSILNSGLAISSSARCKSNSALPRRRSKLIDAPSVIQAATPRRWRCRVICSRAPASESKRSRYCSG